MRLYRELPLIVKSVLLNTEGWLVGSSVGKLLKDEEVEDYDILVPDREKFANTLLILTEPSDNLEINSFGGVKVICGEIEMDIWCQELDHFLKNSTFIEYIYNFKKNILLKISNGD